MTWWHLSLNQHSFGAEPLNCGSWNHVAHIVYLNLLRSLHLRVKFSSGNSWSCYWGPEQLLPFCHEEFTVQLVPSKLVWTLADNWGHNCHISHCFTISTPVSTCKHWLYNWDLLCQTAVQRKLCQFVCQMMMRLFFLQPTTCRSILREHPQRDDLPLQVLHWQHIAVNCDNTTRRD